MAESRLYGKEILKMLAEVAPVPSEDVSNAGADVPSEGKDTDDASHAGASKHDAQSVGCGFTI